MTSIRLEFVPVQSFGLGLFGFDHLQLVLADDSTAAFAQDSWRVIEAIQSGSIFGGTLNFLGIDGDLPLSSANGFSGQALVDAIGTPEDRGSRVIFDGIDAVNVWSAIAEIATDLNSQAFPYYAAAWPSSPTPIVNSTSAIASVLYWAGFDISASLPFGLRFSPGANTLLGLPGADQITASSQFSTVLAGFGDDELRGYNNAVQTERLYGGAGDDTFFWSFGDNIKHGGQPGLDYEADGTDTVDYSGVGVVTLTGIDYAVPHRIPDYVATFSGGTDRLFSIEQITWDVTTDQIIAGSNVQLIERPIVLDLRGSETGRDDRLDLTGTTEPLIINAVNATTISVQTETNSGLDAGYWVQQVEWLIGSGGDDDIYVGPTVRIVDGGAGDDLIDARLAEARSGLSPTGADIDIYGGDGDDIIISGTGVTYAEGGAGADTFILSNMTLFDETVEFIIADADALDRLYVPYNFFQTAGGGFDGSELLQVSGGPFTLDGNISESFFEWFTPGSDIERFVGSISYVLDGSDLVMRLLQGEYQEFSDPGDPDAPPFISFVGFAFTETNVRVLDWTDGDLGITFPLTFDESVFNQVGNFEDYPGYSEVVANALTPDRFLPALDLRPDAHIPLEIASLIAETATLSTFQTLSFASEATITVGTDGDDILEVASGGPFTFDGGAGNDTITGSDGGDLLDGGIGDDTLIGGRGNDRYIVDATGDVVVEEVGGGFDRVISSVDYVLGAHVEHLRLAGDAISGTGNALRNTIEGNARDNILDGGEGNDTLVGAGGDDTLLGGAGSDGYIYDLGEGNDVIIDTGGNPDDRDVLIVSGQLTDADITFTRDSATSDDLVLRFSDGGSIRLVGQLSGGGIESLSFTGGQTLDRNAIDVRAANAPITTNAPPSAQADLFALVWLPSVTLPLIALLGNDRDVDADNLTVTDVFNAIGGTATLDGSGNVVLALDPYVEGQTISFEYAISDGQGDTASAGVDIAILAPAVSVNNPPTANDDGSFQVVAGTPLRLSPQDLLANDSDADNDPLSIVSVAAVSGGTVVLDNDGTILFTAEPEFSGPASFQYTIADPSGATDTAIVSVDVTPPNEAPVVNAAGIGRVIEDRTANGFIDATDPDGDALIFRLSESDGPERGTVTLNDDGTFVYRPDRDANGPDGFTVIIDDGRGGLTEQVFDFTIAPRNDRPVANNDGGFVTGRGQSLVIDANALLANDFDVDGDDISILFTFGAFGVFGNGGWSYLNADGDVVFNPRSNFEGLASFSYLVSDGNGGFDTAVVQINVVSEYLV